jgi:hypothetical protein
MATMQEVFEAFQKFASAKKVAGEGFYSLTVYNDGSGNVKDDNGDAAFEFYNLTSALEAINAEVEATAPEWIVDGCGLGCCWFLTHERFGLRYPVGGESGGNAAKAIVNKLAELANRDMPNGWILPIGTSVIYTDDDGDVHDGIIVMVDTDEEHDSTSGLYLVNYSDPDDTDENYQSRFHSWASGTQVKVQPHDEKMRLMLLSLASAYALDLTKMGLLI